VHARVALPAIEPLGYLAGRLHQMLNRASHPVVSVNGVSKHYPSRTLLGFLAGRDNTPDALDAVSLVLGEGEIVGLLGPNGAGKTTLLRIIAGSLSPTTGTVEVRGRIGLVTSDERSFYWRLTGRQNLEFFAALYQLPLRTARTRIGELFDLLGLAYAADRRFDGYSSGMKQRMAIARGLLADPSVVLYDEPTRALDPASARDVRQWIRDNRARSRRTSHLLATNQLGEAELLCDRVVILNRGRVIANGAIADVRSRFRERLVHRIVVQGLPRTDRLVPAAAEWGILNLAIESDGRRSRLRLDATKDSPALSKVLESVLAIGGTIESCQTEELPFDEVFCSLVLEQDSAEAVGAGT
jgi:ABC-2 type transport system ATP-binding protein